MATPSASTADEQHKQATVDALNQPPLQRHQQNSDISMQTADSSNDQNMTTTPQTPNDGRSIFRGPGRQPTSNTVADWQVLEGAVPHSETAEIIRQVEFYFSDENLPQDAHLLARTGDFGDGWVSLNEILGFKKMRKFKPASSVKASLHQSDKLEIWRNKLIRRKEPLRVPLRVKPKVDSCREKNQIMAEKPWMTKAMFKPTGFEEYATEGPIKPEEYQEDLRLFDPEEVFTIRIENAISRYCARRKMHQSTLNIFSKFLLFGGFAAGPRQFVGGLSKQDLEELDKEQILQMTAPFAVSEAVLDGFGPDLADGSWVVDFKGVAKAFLSSSFMASFEWKNERTVAECTNVLRNFYNYLLVHNACPEYQDEIHAARDVCGLAQEELGKLAKVDDAFPGSFNIACSTLHEGAYTYKRPWNPSADWVVEGDDLAPSDKDAHSVFIAGLSAHCSKDQLAEVAAAAKDNTRLAVVSEEHVGLEVVRVEHMSEQAKQVYGHDFIKNTFIKPTGKLHCVYWEVPHAQPKDLSKGGKAALKAMHGTKYEFLMEEDVLHDCCLGLKFEAVVKQLQIGVKWIDSFEYVYPSFFTWTLNERVRDWKEPGPPKAWQRRQNDKKEGQCEQMTQQLSLEEATQELETED